MLSKARSASVRKVDIKCVIQHIKNILLLQQQASDFLPESERESPHLRRYEV